MGLHYELQEKYPFVLYMSPPEETTTYSESSAAPYRPFAPAPYDTLRLLEVVSFAHALHLGVFFLLQNEQSNSLRYFIS